MPDRWQFFSLCARLNWRLSCRFSSACKSVIASHYITPYHHTIRRVARRVTLASWRCVASRCSGKYCLTRRTMSPYIFNCLYIDTASSHLPTVMYNLQSTRAHTSQSYGASSAICDHTVLPATKQVNVPCINPSQAGRYFIYLPYLGGMKGWLS